MEDGVGGGGGGGGSVGGGNEYRSLDTCGWLEFEFEPPDGLVDAEPGDEDGERSAVWIIRVCGW